MLVYPGDFTLNKKDWMLLFNDRYIYKITNIKNAIVRDRTYDYPDFNIRIGHCELSNVYYKDKELKDALMIAGLAPNWWKQEY